MVQGRLTLNARSAGAAAVFLLLAFLAYHQVLPRALFAFNVNTSLGWSLLRLGHYETHVLNQTGPFSGALSRYTWSGPALAMEGERVAITYTVRHVDGRLSLSLDRMRLPPLAPEKIWSQDIRADARDTVEIVVPQTGFYQVSMIFGRFNGNAVVDWEVRP